MALFIGARWRGGGSGRAGKRSTGVGAAGEGAARRGVWLGHGNIVASRRGMGARGELLWRQGRWFGAIPGAHEVVWFWAEARRVGGQVAGAGVRTPS